MSPVGNPEILKEAGKGKSVGRENENAKDALGAGVDDEVSVGASGDMEEDRGRGEKIPSLVAARFGESD